MKIMARIPYKSYKNDDESVLVIILHITLIFCNIGSLYIFLEMELHCSSLWVWLCQRVIAASTECSAFSAAIAFSLGKLGLSHISLKKEQRSKSSK